MRKAYLIIVVFIIFLILLFSLTFVNIPSPSKLVSENFQLEIQ